MSYLIHSADTAQKLDDEGNVLATTDVLTLYDQNRKDKAQILAALVAANEALNLYRDGQIQQAREEVTAQFQEQLTQAQARIAELEAGNNPAAPVDANGVPEWVEMWRFREMLITWGIMPEQITVMIEENTPDPVERAKALNRWEFAGAVRRDHSLVTTLASALGRTEEELDAFFIAALAIA